MPSDEPHPPGRFFPLACLLGVLLGGCDGPPERIETRRASAPIQGGETDDADTSVVAIANKEIQEICSGSLIAPNLVLTAAHCVSKTITTGMNCAAFVYGGTTDPVNLAFTSATKAPSGESGYAKVREAIALPADGELLCQRDIALVILEEPVVVEPSALLVPRVDEPAVVGELFTAIGYGQAGGGLGIGTRRRLDGLSVACIADCKKNYLDPLEWLGHPAIAHTGGRPGDSGSPALDDLRRVLGVFVRHFEHAPASDLPDELVYTSIDAHADWLKEKTTYAVGLIGADPPPWVSGTPTDPRFSAPIGGACDDTCATDLCADEVCTRPCNDAGPCPDGYACEANEAEDVCVPAPEPEPSDDASSSCAVHPSRPSWSPGLLMSVAAVMSALRRLRWR